MGTGHKLYWLKGGLFGILVSVLVSIYWIFTNIAEPCLLSGIPENFQSCPGDVVALGGIVFVVSGISFFVVGALFGWIYGKMKGKKEVKNAKV
jgi:hypothetical protein